MNILDPIENAIAQRSFIGANYNSPALAPEKHRERHFLASPDASPLTTKLRQHLANRKKAPVTLAQVRWMEQAQ